jgi:hypothetical protein
VLLTLDAALAVTETLTLRDDTGMAARFDDVRPFLLGGQFHAALLIYDPDADDWTRAGIAEIGDGAYRNLRCFGPRAGMFQQGWAPLLTDAGPRLLAGWEPTEVLRFDSESGDFMRERLRLVSRVAERFWSASPGVPIPGGYLLLVNETIAQEDQEESTFSRFALLDAGYQLTAISPQFFLNERGQDAASGLARQGDRLIAGFTTADGAMLATIDLDAVFATLTPVLAPGRRIGRA